MFKFERNGKNYCYYIKGLFHFEKRGFCERRSILGYEFYYRVNKSVKFFGKTRKIGEK